MALEMLPEYLRDRGGKREIQGLDERNGSLIFSLLDHGLIEKDGVEPEVRVGRRKQQRAVA